MPTTKHILYTPDLDTGERMIVNIIFLQNSTTIIVKVDANLLPTVNTIVSENWLTTCGDPHSG